MSLRLKISGVLLAVATTVAGSVALASPASAAGLIRVNVKVTTTQCPRGGTPKRVNATITQPGTSGSNWTGDTVSNLSAFAGNRSNVIGSNFCQTEWYGAGYYWYWDTFRYAYNNGQTLYI